MSEVIAEPKILQRPTRVRYLKLIAVFKILQGLLLLVLGFSLLFINSRASWLDAISDWASDELLLVHSRPVLYLLNKLQTVVANGNLHGPALLTSFFEQKLVDEALVFVAPKIVGDAAAPGAVTGLACDRIAEAMTLQLHEVRRFDGDVMLNYRTVK